MKLSEMFPAYGKAFIEAICQHFHLQDCEESDWEPRLQHVTELILSNQLPRELQYLNSSAKTVRELYVRNGRESER